MFKKKFSFLTVLIVAILVAAISITGTYFLTPKSNLSKKTEEIMNIINNNFDGEVNEEVIDKAMFTAIINSLDDKYGAYYSKEDATTFLKGYDKENQGLGISFLQSENSTMLVVEVTKNSPADKAGIKVYDEIIAVDDLTVKDNGSDKIVEYIAGKSNNQTITLKIIRNNKEITLNATLGVYEKQTVFYEKVDDIGYIKITHFDDSTLEGFKLALNTLKSQNVKGLLFDLRNNPGGTVDSVSAVLDLLLPECDIISAKYKNGQSKVLFKSDSKEETLPMAVLTNNATASASELFAAAIREIKGGKLIGEKTYGKGKIQTIFNVSDGSVVKITVGKFYSPKGNNWDEVGIEPDIVVKLTEDQQKNFYLLTTKTDPVILKGIESLKQ